MLSFCQRCVSRHQPAPDGLVLLLNGVGIPEALPKEFPAKVVDTALYPTLDDAFQHLAQVSSAHESKNAFVVSVDSLLPADVRAGPGWGGPPMCLALVYTPLAEVVAAAPTGEDLRRRLVQFGALIRGAEVAAPDATELLPRARFDQLMADAARRFGPTHARQMTTIAAYLRRQLGLQALEVRDVWLRPRFDHDVVVVVAKAEAPAKTAASIWKRVSQGAPREALLRWPRHSADSVPACLRRPRSLLTSPRACQKDCVLCDAPTPSPSPYPYAADPVPQGTTLATLTALGNTLGGLAGHAAPIIEVLSAVGTTFLDSGSDPRKNPAATVTVRPQRGHPHAATCIWLHGLGDNGHHASLGLADLTDSLPHFKFIFPTAPIRPITLLAGVRQRGWFDIQAYDFECSGEDEAGMTASAAVVHDLCYKELQSGLSADRLIIGGFSQGGAVAVFAALTFPERLGGAVCCSSYAPLHSQLRPHLSSRTPPPVFMAHGTADFIIPILHARRSANFLRQAGVPLTLHEYPNQGHDISIAEMNHLVAWLRELLSFC